ncbi:NAD-dependent succinate-semialdehyde dehydrogenase [Marinobacterium arenosum]|uniref:NAD-dependent succinate-semialdehyde dehydrogenase n=1 Tax=Marinobacterium arenosum TaxID=2862496 RepID=UPI001C93E301|nr:NAD-dependent succinate-semialdehyde dehydrogenase [Marinobacterium arenosum]MBY4677167.1 NAD-dependent succinate-semialdehyde dehydrogenase [Marinobacterium arenosum]
MDYQSINPATGELLQHFELMTPHQLELALEHARQQSALWRGSGFDRRAGLLQAVAGLLAERREMLATLISEEMGKLLPEALAEVDKCAAACLYYADNGAEMLIDELVDTQASKSLISYEPLGTVLAIMPWNFPLWQVFRCVAPTLMAGNTVLLKHAPNVPQCARAIEQLLLDAGAPEGLLINLTISIEQCAEVIADRRVQAVAFTGSEAAGRQIAALAGQHLKKVVLELGGSDPFIVLPDADLDKAVEVAVRARFGNAGQICIAAKRFILVDAIAGPFIDKLLERARTLQPGNPIEPATTLAPLARPDLLDKVHRQVLDSIEEGAAPLLGCEPLGGPGNFYPASVLDHVQLGMTAFNEELFGPVAAIIRARDEQDAIALANGTRFGLGASIWTRDLVRGELLARQLEVGACFVNAQVASDVRLPFGGIKASGLGRELGEAGIREFCNIKTLWLAE